MADITQVERLADGTFVMDYKMQHRFAIALPWYACLALLVTTSAIASPSSNRQTPLVRAIQRVRPSVVNIHSQKNIPVSGAGFPQVGPAASKMSGMGTGVVLDERGYIITNYHVIEDVASIRATLVDGSTYNAEVVARDPETDLAMLKITPLTPLAVMPMGSSDDLMHGETVIAIGNAFGYQHTTTVGIISELHRDVRLSDEQTYRDLIQTDASINPGNSGGPLINADGEMIGLNVAIRAGAQGIGFAIPVSDVARVAAKLISIRHLNNTWHGIVGRSADLNDPIPGRVIVRRVETGSPAAESGIQPGDRLLSANGRRLELAYDLERALLGAKPSDIVPISFLRDGQERTVTMSLRSAPSTNDDPSEFVWRRLGARFSPGPDGPEVRKVSAQLRGGLRVVQIADGSAASNAGLLTGDILVGLQQWETLTLDNVVYVISKRNVEELNPLRFFVIRGGQIHRGWLNIPRDE